MIDISVTDLVKSFDLEKKILDGISFQVDTGERVGLLGKNGAGKTTLFNILTGDLDYDSGEVLIAPGRRVGLISQIPVYPAGYTVEDVLRSAFQRTTALKEEMDALTRRMEQGDSDAHTLRRYGELTARFEGLGGYDTDTAVNKVSNGLSIDGDMRRRLFDQLSGGEKTRLSLARLLLTQPELLMLDEPLAGLDPMAREMFLEFLEGLTGQGVSVVMVSHNVDALAQHAARIIGMKQGKIVMDGSCQEVLGDSRALRTIGLLGSEAAQTAELLRANGVLPGSGLPVTYEALRDEIIGALTGEKGENR